MFGGTETWLQRSPASLSSPFLPMNLPHDLDIDPMPDIPSQGLVQGVAAAGHTPWLRGLGVTDPSETTRGGCCQLWITKAPPQTNSFQRNDHWTFCSFIVFYLHHYYCHRQTIYSEFIIHMYHFMNIVNIGQDFRETAKGSSGRKCRWFIVM